MTSKLNGFQLDVKGRVQGIGFRPFVFRLATSLGLCGSVQNTAVSVEIKLNADFSLVEHFSQRLIQQCPRPGFIESITREPYQFLVQPNGFSILPSLSEGEECTLSFPPDLAICPACIQELINPTDRRYQYPLINCTQCGPRYTIIHDIPYDRTHTSMAAFPMCVDCQAEYNNPLSRRFHAEPICCSTCGPAIWFQQNIKQREEGKTHRTILDSLKICVKQLIQGKIIAIKGIGGFHLVCDATNESTIRLLRTRKQRPSKPLAIMFKDRQHIHSYFSCTSNVMQQCLKLLESKPAPIVLLSKTYLTQALPAEIAPRQHLLGVMLAYSPLHWLLLDLIKKPLVMTSANPPGEPICITNNLALQQLKPFADGWLLHDRNINHRCDDSVINIINNKPRLMRRARGFVPDSLPIPDQLDHGLLKEKYLLALGADLKNCVGITIGANVFLSSYQGDLANSACLQAMQQNLEEMQTLLKLPENSLQAVVVDSHPDYYSSHFGRKIAEKYQTPIIQVQHHHAHFASCLFENQVLPDQPVLGIIFDGLGFGDDGTFWGGEFLLGDYASVQRVANLKPFPLLGGDKANKQPWRNLIALLAQSDCLQKAKNILTTQNIAQEEIDTLLKFSHRFPLSSSVGRLFDAVAALLNIAPYEQTFEGEAAMQLEALASYYKGQATSTELFKIIPQHKCLLLDSSPLWYFLIEQLNNKEKKAKLAFIFLNSLVEGVFQTIISLQQQGKQFHSIALSGGVFQNAFLLSTLQNKLESEGFTVYTPQQIPCNDSGIALGQIVVALTQTEIKNNGHLCA